MSKRVVLCIVILLFVSGCTYETENATVSRVIDGDTIELTTGEKVRLIGIDTPEFGEPYFYASKSRLEELVLNETVTLESDFEDTDKYNRLLRYIFVNEENVNIRMVKEGYAYAYIFSEIRYKKELMDAENYAKNMRNGLWSL